MDSDNSSTPAPTLAANNVPIPILPPSATGLAVSDIVPEVTQAGASHSSKMDLDGSEQQLRKDSAEGRSRAIEASGTVDKDHAVEGYHGRSTEGRVQVSSNTRRRGNQGWRKGARDEDGAESKGQEGKRKGKKDMGRAAYGYVDPSPPLPRPPNLRASKYVGWGGAGWLYSLPCGFGLC